MAITLPRGSMLLIEAKDLLATPAGTTATWNKVTEHNRRCHLKHFLFYHLELLILKPLMYL